MRTFRTILAASLATIALALSTVAVAPSAQAGCNGWCTPQKGIHVTNSVAECPGKLMSLGVAIGLVYDISISKNRAGYYNDTGLSRNTQYFFTPWGRKSMPAAFKGKTAVLHITQYRNVWNIATDKTYTYNIRSFTEAVKSGTTRNIALGASGSHMYYFNSMGPNYDVAVLDRIDSVTVGSTTYKCQ
jgi:hypothetical protein